jgi:hypothetical protein
VRKLHRSPWSVGTGRASGAGAGLNTVRHGHDMKVICPKCRATTNLGPSGADLSDTHYKLECPVLRERRIAKGSDIKIECLYMRRARDSAILKLRRGRKAKRQERDIVPA